MTGIASIPPDGLTCHEWCAAMRALNPDADTITVPACFVTTADEDDITDELTGLIEVRTWLDTEIEIDAIHERNRLASQEEYEREREAWMYARND